MTIVIPENHIQLAIRHEPLVGLQYGYVTCGFRDTLSVLTPVETAESVYQSWVDTMVPILCHDVRVAGWIATVQVDDGNPTYQGGDPVTGNGNFESTPPAVSALIRKQSFRPGRRGRGRMFLPWYLDETNIGEAGDLSGGQVTTIQTAIDAFFDDIIGNDIIPVILHREGGPGSDAPTAVESFTVESQVATQRRRQRR